MNFYYHTITTLILAFFYYVGFKFPDYDLKLKLSHRNMLTHSPLLVVILFLLHQNKILTLIYKMKYDITDFVIVGLSLGIAIHLLYDLFPKSFKGMALLQFPIIEKGLTEGETIVIMVIFITFLTGFSVYKLVNYLDLTTSLILIIITFIVKRKSEKKFFRVAFLFVIIFSLLIYLKQKYLL
ncbi:hypothetical protein [Leptotrichia sp. oral taxon 847]|uniref:hypothetical protein n=1 Tax=Leptotrichia sp. oral taxon 847 TaxID=1785996 RepID=UPI000768318E|nr:hypothetical protein [Leptotrichia sp. oral taxon 847]AMD94303.1 hypothetical protein AXF11_00965 [Leptotrichia sp. oral taxon 847]